MENRSEKGIRWINILGLNRQPKRNSKNRKPNKRD